MPNTEGRIDVDPGQADVIAVSIQTTAGAEVTTYTARNGSSAHDNPASIAVATSFHVTGTGSYKVVCTFGGVTIHDELVSVGGYGAGPTVVSPVIDDRELADVISGADQIAETYTGEGSHQAQAADLTLDADAGSADGADPSFLAAVMGNLLADEAMTTDANYLGGLIGHYNVPDSPSTYPKGAVLAGVGDGVNDDSLNAVTAYIDGDSAVTRAKAFFGVKSNNSTPGSGVDFGLDLQDASHDGFTAVDKDFFALAVVRLVNDVCLLIGSGAPVNGTTGDNVAGPGSLYVDIADGKLYANSAAKTNPTWGLVGAQTA